MVIIRFTVNPMRELGSNLPMPGGGEKRFEEVSFTRIVFVLHLIDSQPGIKISDARRGLPCQQLEVNPATPVVQPNSGIAIGHTTSNRRQQPLSTRMNVKERAIHFKERTIVDKILVVPYHSRTEVMME
jgi:hypothetical protein